MKPRIPTNPLWKVYVKTLSLQTWDQMNPGLSELIHTATDNVLHPVLWVGVGTVLEAALQGPK